jgi:hypothetical protein
MSGLFLASLRLLKAIRRASADPEFRALFSIMILLLISGTIFYVMEENWTIVDALYFCVMTMSTVGCGDLKPSSDLSKIFTMVYSLITIGIFVGVASKLAQALLTTKENQSN